jgi:hypothetical protein
MKTAIGLDGVHSMGFAPSSTPACAGVLVPFVDIVLDYEFIWDDDDPFERDKCKAGQDLREDCHGRFCNRLFFGRGGLKKSFHMAQLLVEPKTASICKDGLGTELASPG